MGFWDSYNKEMVRQGYTSHSEFRADDDEIETGSENDIQYVDSRSDDEYGSETNDDFYEREAAQAVEQGDFDTALDKYLESLNNGNMHALLKIGDILAILAVYDKYNRTYRIGSDRNSDLALEFAVTIYVVSLLFPECESEAEDHLNILQRQCSDEEEFQIMVQRGCDRVSESIQKDPIGFVRAILSQYQKRRS